MSIEGIALIIFLILIVGIGTIRAVIQRRKNAKTNAFREEQDEGQTLSYQNAIWIMERLIDEKRSAVWGRDNKLYILAPYNKKGAEWMTVARFWIKDNVLYGEEIEVPERRIMVTSDQGKLEARMAQMYAREVNQKYQQNMQRINGKHNKNKGNGNGNGRNRYYEPEPEFENWQPGW